MKLYWVNHLAINNIKRHKRRNIFSLSSLIIGLTSSFLIIGFSSNASKSIEEECYKQIDYRNLSITKEIKTESKNGGLSIVRNVRPSLDEMKSLKDVLNKYEIELSFDALLTNIPSIKYKKEDIKNITYECIYSFENNYINPTYLLEGEIPNKDTLSSVLINKEAYKYLKEIMGKNPIGEKIKIYQENETNYYTNEEYEPVVSDYFIYDKEVKIIGEIDEIDFLSTPKIYYSYLALKDHLSNQLLNNLSSYYSRDISWVNRIDESDGNDPLSSYSYKLFLKKENDIKIIKEDIANISSPFSLSSSAEIRSGALINLIEASSTGMELFLVISLLGTGLIIGIISFSFYVEEKKNIAILSCLGANRKDINKIYCLETIFIGLLAFTISIIIAPIFQLLINYVVYKITNFKDIIKIPFLSYLNFPFGLIIIVLLSSIFISLLSTLLPILCSKKISLKEELKDE